MNRFMKFKALFASYVRRLAEANKRRLEQERAFYRNLNAYCRANNLSTICEDDWKTAAHDKN
jgi:uncharacterized protein YgiB involved in biofilm formation